MARDYDEFDETGVPESLIGYTVEIVSAHLGHNSVALADVPGFIQNVHGALTSLQTPAEPEETAAEPIVPVRQSVKPEYIICLECGKKMQTLKAHLRSRHGLDPHEYRAKYRLPADYPMVAPHYKDRLRVRAEKLGLVGRMRAGRTDTRKRQGKPPLKAVGGPKHGK